jgi:hypothetical protein
MNRRIMEPLSSILALTATAALAKAVAWNLTCDPFGSTSDLHLTRPLS